MQRFGVGCVRVSTDRQERSIDEQKEAIRAAARHDGVTLLDDDWCEDEGISGSILDRPGLQKLTAICRTRPDVTDVYFWKRNRLARSVDPLDGMNIEREIEKSGKKVHFVQGLQKTGNKLLDFIASGLEYAEAGQYLVNLSSDTIRGLVPLTKAGYDAGRPTPFGFDRLVMDTAGRELYRVRDLGGGMRHKISPGGEIQIYENGVKPIKDESAHSTLVLGDSTRVALVRQIFDLYVYAEKGLRAIAADLNAKDIPSPRGGFWSIGTLRAILTNPVYYGANVWNVRSMSKYHLIVNGNPTPYEHDGRSVRFKDPKNWIVADEKHGFPAIVSKDLFDLAQEKRRGRNNPFMRGKAITAPYFLSGLAVCACGNHLQGHTKRSGKLKGYRKYFYYVCGGYAMKGRTVCKRYLLPKELVEGPILAAFNRRIKTLTRVENIRKQVEALLTEQGSPRDQEETFNRRIKEIEAQCRHWEAAVGKGLDLDQGVAKLNELTREKKALEADLALARKRKSVDVSVEALSREILANLERLDQVLEAGSVAEVKAILRAYIGRIEVDPEKNKARVGFLRMPARALVSEGVQSRTRISMVAGGGFEPPTSGL